MNKELQSKLMEKFPKIFPSAPKADMITEPIHLYGIECYDGWYNLIETACKLIQERIDWREKYNGPDKPKIPQVVALQIKQKFGGLRFYYSGGDPTINGIITTIEELSYSVCEECGINNNIIHTKGYITTVCKSCHEKNKMNSSKFYAKQYEFDFK